VAAAEPVECWWEEAQGGAVGEEDVGDLAPVADAIIEFVEGLGEVPGLEIGPAHEVVAEPHVVFFAGKPQFPHRRAELALAKRSLGSDQR